jgi:hydroxymethyl cephem carbamoyltransferase
MLVAALKPGHDGSVAVLRDRELKLSLESEKDSFPRHAFLTPTTILSLGERLDQLPDVVALGGWRKGGPLGCKRVGAGYRGGESVLERDMSFFGKRIRFFSSSHERSHIMMAVGMAPAADAPNQIVLVWEGAAGSFFLLDERARVVRSIPVLSEPGGRYSALYALADPTVPDHGALPRLDDSGKLMALAAYGDHRNADRDLERTVVRILTLPTVHPLPKGELQDSPVYNAGVEAESTKIAAALLSQRIFEAFARTAERRLAPGMPLRISGGCGLNCAWNAQWRELGLFSSVFVPPCPNDSGSAIGTAIDALAAVSGEPQITWSVYSGLEFERDLEPSPSIWNRRPLEHRALADDLAAGAIVAWVQGRWEIGPRALGNRSLLAEPFSAASHTRLNEIKQRERYRPIAPSCRVEDVQALFHESFEDPYMLYFRKVRSTSLRAITHVDGSARVQTVRETDNRPLHDLLTACAERSGAGVLCNTSLNFKGCGFINRMSDLVDFCESRGVDDMVVGDAWYRRQDATPAP